MRCLLPLVFLAACGARTSLIGAGPAPDTGEEDDAGPFGTDVSEACSDRDGDAYGVGPGCEGPDCDDLDPSIHEEADCAARCGDPSIPSRGCPCTATVPTVCYTGPPGTLSNAPCAAGIAVCGEGEWSACEGEVLPVEEVCDTEDNDCDAEVDEGTFNRCGDCDPDCRVSCWGPSEPCEAWGDDVARLEETSNGTLVVEGGGAEGGGNWRTTFECRAETLWREVQVTAEAPKGTSIEVAIRTADTTEALAGARWIELGTLPGHEREFRLAGILDGGALRKPIVELRASLHAGPGVSPTLQQVDLLYNCVGF